MNKLRSMLCTGLIFSSASLGALELEDEPKELIELRERLKELQTKKEAQQESRDNLRKEKKRLLEVAKASDSLESAAVNYKNQFKKLYDQVLAAVKNIEVEVEQDQLEAERLRLWVQTSLETLVQSEDRMLLSVQFDKQWSEIDDAQLVCRVPRSATKAEEIISSLSTLEPHLNVLKTAIDQSTNYPELESQRNNITATYVDFVAKLSDLHQTLQGVFNKYSKYPEVCKTFKGFKALKSMTLVQIRVNGSINKIDDLNIQAIFKDIESREKALEFIKSQRRAILGIGNKFITLKSSATSLLEVVSAFDNSVETINTIQRRVFSGRYITEADMSDFNQSVHEVKSDLQKSMVDIFEGDRSYQLVRPAYTKLVLAIKRTKLRNKKVSEESWWEEVERKAQVIGIGDSGFPRLPSGKELSYYLNVDQEIEEISKLIRENQG